jgi:hypothetical protein
MAATAGLPATPPVLTALTADRLADEADLRDDSNREESMRSVHIVEERAPYLLLARGHHFAVVERRNGQLYSLHCGRSAPAPMTDEGAAAVIGDRWSDEFSARRTFEEIASRYTELAERLW